ncbi:CheC, inhibitor of MCP methylation [Schlesneria paludicola]|uniref:CheC, inhibitor of MCP methylation n=1 Tax=Schlesneria paludicola TaxID=360056 RepID=UPI00029B30D9|nr:CheC, inhibitor of MCP methylation [Schlesneria paludicola]
MQSQTFNDRQIAQLTKAFHQGAAEASAALVKWLNSTMTMAIDSVNQCPLDVAIGVLGEGDSPVCMCLMEMQGTLTGHMLLAFDDPSGLALSDILTGRTAGTANEWGEVESSCVLETMNIAGSAYLNGISNDLSQRSHNQVELIPSPPMFLRDFAESLLETAFMDQAVANGDVVFARTRFDLQGQALRWTFLLIPDPASLQRLSEILTDLS